MIIQTKFHSVKTHSVVLCSITISYQSVMLLKFEGLELEVYHIISFVDVDVRKNHLWYIHFIKQGFGEYVG